MSYQYSFQFCIYGLTLTCSSSEVDSVGKARRQTMEEEARQTAACQQFVDSRTQKVQHRVSNVWRARKSDCTCTAEAIRHPAQGDRDDNCPYCIHVGGGGMATVGEKCWNEGECCLHLDEQA